MVTLNFRNHRRSNPNLILRDGQTPHDDLSPAMFFLLPLGIADEFPDDAEKSRWQDKLLSAWNTRNSIQDRFRYRKVNLFIDRNINGGFL
jgi:hypothetical protein